MHTYLQINTEHKKNMKESTNSITFCISLHRFILKHLYGEIYEQTFNKSFDVPDFVFVHSSAIRWEIELNSVHTRCLRGGLQCYVFTIAYVRDLLSL